MDNMVRLARIVFEYEDGAKQEVVGKQAVLYQARVNSSGILSGVEITDVEETPVDQPSKIL